MNELSRAKDSRIVDRMVQINVQLPPALEAQALKAGLLRPEAIESLLRDELTRLEFWLKVERLRDLPGDVPSSDEIEGEIKASRAARGGNANRS